jgi:hypothetical protein
MPHAPPSTPPTHGTGRPRGGRLLWLTAVVGVGHWLLLAGLPAAKAFSDPPRVNAALSFTVQAVDPPQQAPIPAVRQATPATDPNPTSPVAAETGSSRDATEAALHAGAQSAAASADQVAADAFGDAVVVGDHASGLGDNADLLLAAVSADAAGPSANNAAPYRFRFPEPVRILYDVQGRSGFSYSASAEMLWRHDGATYQSALRVSKLGIPLSVWTSKGSLGAQGVAPMRFGEKKGRSSEIAAHFQRDKGIISFSRNAPDVVLQTAAQDHLSTFFQLSSMVSGEPARFTPGSAIAFQSANAYGAEDWTFKVGALESMGLPPPAANGLRLTRDHGAEYDTKVEVWLAPTLGYLPVRIRLSQTNGDFLELVARTTEIPQ